MTFFSFFFYLKIRPYTKFNNLLRKVLETQHSGNKLLQGSCLDTLNLFASICANSLATPLSFVFNELHSLL